MTTHQKEGDKFNAVGSASADWASSVFAPTHRREAGATIEIPSFNGKLHQLPLAVIAVDFPAFKKKCFPLKD